MSRLAGMKRALQAHFGTAKKLILRQSEDSQTNPPHQDWRLVALGAMVEKENYFILLSVI
jgi:hypothetical protein